MIEKLNIKNFRGIKNLSLLNLRRVNVLVGKNGSGKTSVLEAVGVAANPRAPQWIHNFGLWRDLPPANLGSDYIFRSIFRNLETRDPVSLECTLGGQEQFLEISPQFNSTYFFESNTRTAANIDLSAAAESSTGKEELSGISYHLRCGGAVNESFLRLKADGFEIQQTIKGSSPGEIKSPGAFFIHGRRATSAGETADVLTKLFESKDEGQFVEALKRINPRISRVIPAIRNKQPMVFFDLGMKRLMPMNLMGDGFCRVCLMLTGIVSNKSKTLIVDEIDSGLHATVMADFWGSLIRLSLNQNVQVFCTTHSEEMLHNAIDAFADHPDMLRLIRIDKCNEETTAQSYNFEQFLNAAKSNLDVR